MSGAVLVYATEPLYVAVPAQPASPAHMRRGTSFVVICTYRKHRTCRGSMRGLTWLVVRAVAAEAHTAPTPRTRPRYGHGIGTCTGVGTVIIGIPLPS